MWSGSISSDEGGFDSSLKNDGIGLATEFMMAIRFGTCTAVAGCYSVPLAVGVRQFG